MVQGGHEQLFLGRPPFLTLDAASNRMPFATCEGLLKCKWSICIGGGGEVCLLDISRTAGDDHLGLSPEISVLQRAHDDRITCYDLPYDVLRYGFHVHACECQDTYFTTRPTGGGAQLNLLERARVVIQLLGQGCIDPSCFCQLGNYICSHRCGQCFEGCSYQK